MLSTAMQILGLVGLGAFLVLIGPAGLVLLVSVALILGGLAVEVSRAKAKADR